MATIAYVTGQATALGANGGTTAALDTTGCKLLVVSAGFWAGGAGPETFSDSAGNSWTEIHDQSFSNTGLQWYYCLAPTTSAAHTFTYTSVNSYTTLHVLGYSATIGFTYDQKATNQGNVATIQPGSLTPAQPDSLLIANQCFNIASAQAIDSSFTERYDNILVPGTNMGLQSSDLILPAPAATNPTMSGGGATDRTAAMAVFYETPFSYTEREPLVIEDGVIEQLQSDSKLTDVVYANADLTPDNAVVRVDGTRKEVQTSTASLADTGALTLAQNASLETSGAHTPVVTILDSAGSAAIEISAQTAASLNTAVGISAGAAITTGDYNTLMGANAGSSIDTGTGNFCFGASAGLSIEGGLNNIALGRETLDALVNGSYNVAVGTFALGNGTNNYRCIAVGYAALNAATGNDNVAMGNNAGRTLTSGTDNVFIGGNAGHTGQLVGADNTIGIGKDVVTTADNQVVIGNASHLTTKIAGGNITLNCYDTNSIATATRSSILGGYSNTISQTATGCCISFGYSNDISGGWGHSYCYVGGYNSHITATTASSDYSAILSGTSNAVTSSTVSTIAGGSTNSITSSNYSFIGGGQTNAIGTSNYGTIGGGLSNSVTGSIYSVIAGGQTGTIADSQRSFIGGGVDNDIDTSSYSFVGGGNNNNITDSTYAAIVSGTGNNITSPVATSTQSAIISGTTNTITDSDGCNISGGSTNSIIGVSSQCVIVGGFSNSIAAASLRAVVVGGRDNDIDDGSYSTIAGGFTNTISESDYAIVGGGAFNDISATSNYATVVGGRNGDIADAPYSTVLGGNVNNITSGADYSQASGLYSVVNNHGERGHATGRHDSTSGSAQWSDFVVFNGTTDATWTTLYTNGASTNMLMPANSCWTYEAHVAALETDGSAGGGYSIRGVIRRDGAAGATVVATEAQVVIGEDTAAWGGIRALASGNNLLIQVQGAAGTNINWTGTVRVTQVIVES